MKSQVHVFTLSIDEQHVSMLTCPVCAGEPQNLIHIGEIIPQMVIGDHAFEVEAYQCYQCQQIVIEVIDDFND